jgi:hypothetical protein
VIRATHGLIGMKVTDDDYWVCSDCLPVIANGDYTHLDNYYVSEDQSGEISLEDKIDAIDSGMESAGGYIVPGSEEDEYSTRGCDCCCTKLAGYRARCAVLGD